MKRLAILMMIGLMAAGCGDDDSTSPGGSSAPNQVVFRANLSPANEVPPVTNAEASGSGTVTITMNVTRNTANQITGGTFDFQFTMTGLPTTTVLTLAHIHTGAAGVNGGIVVNTGLSAATGIATPAGSGSFEARGITATDVSVFQQILDNPAAFYFNVHSATNPGGVARGQLTRQ